MTARRSIVAVFAAALATAVAGVSASAQDGGGPDYNARCGERDCRVEEMTTDWELQGVGRQPNVLRLVYGSGGCGRDDGWAIVRETRESIHLETRQHTVVAVEGAEPLGCTSDFRFVRIVVRLDRPVGGRRVEGGPRLGEDIWGGGRVPRVAGLAPGDAVHVLGRQGFLARTAGDPTGRVVAQRPKPGTRVRTEGKRVLGTVRLKVRRLAFGPPRALVQPGLDTFRGPAKAATLSEVLKAD